MELSSILPIVVPRSYFALGNFPGLALALRHPEFCVTWIDASMPDSILYVPKQFFEELGLTAQSLHQVALANLRSSGALFTHENVDGHQSIWKAMMHEDALGSSRLLLTDEIKDAFPEGCLVGLPDRSCAIVISRSASQEQMRDAQALVRRCFDCATIPMLGDTWGLELFELDI